MFRKFSITLLSCLFALGSVDARLLSVVDAAESESEIPLSDSEAVVAVMLCGRQESVDSEVTVSRLDAPSAGSTRRVIRHDFRPCAAGELSARNGFGGPLRR
jgi:hypothetical protein